MDQQQQAQQAAHMMLAIMPFLILISLLVVAFLVFLYWRIFTKAGMAGALSLIILFPGVGWLIVLCLLAFAEWKVVPIPQQVYYSPAPPSYPPSTPPTQL